MLIGLVLLFTSLLTAVVFVQTLYLESLRLIKKDYPALAFFREELEERLGMDTDRGALCFSLLKHTLLATCGVVYVVASESPLRGLEGLLAALTTLLLSSYIIPQVLYRRSSGRWVLYLIPVLKALVLPFRPLVASLNWLARAFELSNGSHEHDKEPAPGEEIAALIEAGEQEGILEREDSKLIQSVVKFGDKRVREVMTPRHRIVAVSVNSTLDDLRNLVINERYSRIPVYEETIDHVIGFVHVRDMFELDAAKRAETTVPMIMRQIGGVPETKLVSKLFKEMQETGTHIVYVVDGYGNTSGIATMEDLVEEIVGEIRDEHEPPDDLRKEPGGAIVVSGSYDVDHLHELFDFRPSTPIEATTVGGLVTEWLGEVPKPGTKFERDGLRIDVIDANETRVERLRIQPAAAA
ncbi:MAG: HlyC/CorC family transporter [Bryobacterales bacterium]|nr:HlyC/CorC family transporter [Bryobacterales bacterium]